MKEIIETSVLEDAIKDSQEITLSFYVALLGLDSILEHCKSLSEHVNLETDSKIVGVVSDKVNLDGSVELVVENLPLFQKKIFNDIFIVNGVSIFEKYCKDLFILGLKYSSNRVKIFGNLQINVLDITNSNDIKQTLINKIVDDINFQNTINCEENFVKAFDFKIFDNRDQRYKFEKYLNHRHLISHNLGVVDHSYIKKMGLKKEFTGKTILIADDKLEEFRNLLEDIILKIDLNIFQIIHKELEK